MCFVTKTRKKKKKKETICVWNKLEKRAKEGKNNQLFIKLLNLSMKEEKKLKYCNYSTGFPRTLFPRDDTF